MPRIGKRNFRLRERISIAQFTAGLSLKRQLHRSFQEPVFSAWSCPLFLFRGLQRKRLSLRTSASSDFIGTVAFITLSLVFRLSQCLSYVHNTPI